jgi:hypothetical protein
LLDRQTGKERNMTPQHFKEIYDTVLMSTRSSKKDIAIHLNVTTETLLQYGKKGVPLQKKRFVMDKLREYLFANLGGL